MSTHRSSIRQNALLVPALVAAFALILVWANGRAARSHQPGGGTAAATTVREPAPPGGGPLPPAAAAPAPRQTTPATSVSEVPSEEALMRRLREEVDAHPATALGLARDAEQLHPRGRDADERSFLKMRALVHLGDVSGAREEAYLFYERNPASPYAGRVHQLTGLRPIPGPPGKR